MENISITSTQTIKEVQESFHRLFPYLKLEFFTKLHKDKSSSWSRFQIADLDQKLSELGLQNSKGLLLVQSRMKVSDLEQEFQNIFGFGVQVFRKSKDIWLETTQSDHWNLETQNHHGKEASENLGTMMYDPREES